MFNTLRMGISILVIAILAGCASLPEDIKHSAEPVSPVSASMLSELSDKYWDIQPSKQLSAVSIQDSGWDALAQRLALVESAEHTIDIQYYIWNSDVSGIYLASRLLAAADRGVRVRVMLDDINLNEREDLLVTLDAHPNVEIRVFNPIPSRRGVVKWLNVLGDFSRLNRRMHNKSFTVDGVATVVGGRNIGDEYFDLSDDINFRDRDVLVIGHVVTDIQQSFEDYWSSRWSYPVELLGGEALDDFSQIGEISLPAYKHYPELPQDSTEAKRLLQNVMSSMSWVSARFVYDQPVPNDEKNTSVPKETAQELLNLASQSEHEILLESAYLIFDDGQLESFKELEDQNVTIKALTNSMASNDLVTNHSGYAGRREDMLESGIELFELKPEASLCVESTKDSEKCAPTTGYGLHSKSAVFDGKIATIGSFNFNLRSTYLNTESLLIIESNDVAEELANNINRAMADDNSWHLSLDDGDVIWYSGEESFDSEPETGKWERFQSQFLQLLPIEKYL